MARPDEGLRNEALIGALREAVAGRPAKLEELLARLGGALDARPNLRLAAAFGAEVGPMPGAVAPLLGRLGGEDAAPDDARVYLPIAAAHGWVGRLRAGRDVEAAWAALAELAADERGPVRVGTIDALVALGSAEGVADELVARAASWMELDDREMRFGAAASVLEALGDARVLARVRDVDALLDYLSHVIADVAGASRAAERSDGRRRVLMALPRTLIEVARGTAAGDRGPGWFQEECERAAHPDVRAAFSSALARLGGAAHGLKGAVVETLRASLKSSAKPPRDPTRIRPGAGRGKASRRIK